MRSLNGFGKLEARMKEKMKLVEARKLEGADGYKGQFSCDPWPMWWAQEWTPAD
jgi:hypothetical protein